MQNIDNITLDSFYELTDAEDFFDYFGIEYDEQLVNVKRFHIMREYGALIKTGMQNLTTDESQLLDFLKFSLLRVYGDYKNGHAPSAADVWDMFKDGKLSGCLSCTPSAAQSQGGSCAC